MKIPGLDSVANAMNDPEGLLARSTTALERMADALERSAAAAEAANTPTTIIYHESVGA